MIYEITARDVVMFLKQRRLSRCGQKGTERDTGAPPLVTVPDSVLKCPDGSDHMYVNNETKCRCGMPVEWYMVGIILDEMKKLEEKIDKLNRWIETEQK